jgi:hypothetical protein
MKRIQAVAAFALVVLTLIVVTSQVSVAQRGVRWEYGVYNQVTSDIFVWETGSSYTSAKSFNELMSKLGVKATVGSPIGAWYNWLGSQGFELAAVDGRTFIFKRQQ